MKEKLNAVVTAISNFVDLVANHGIWKIFKGLFVLCACIILIKCAFILDPEYLIREIQNIEIRQAEAERAYRTESDELINQELKLMLEELNASRCSIFEYHNGKANSSGLGFYFMDNSYELFDEHLMPVSDRYKDISLSWIEIDNILYRDGYWWGSIDELKAVDPAFGLRVEEDGMKWFAFYALEADTDLGITQELGVLAVAYDYIPSEVQIQQTGRVLRRAGPFIVDKLYYKK